MLPVRSKTSHSHVFSDNEESVIYKGLQFATPLKTLTLQNICYFFNVN